MLEPNLTHIYGAKLLGTTLLPASLLVLAGVLAWQVWKSKQNLIKLEQQVKIQQRDFTQQLSELKQQSVKQTIVSKTEYPNILANSSKLVMLKRLLEDNISLREQFS